MPNAADEGGVAGSLVRMGPRDGRFYGACLSASSILPCSPDMRPTIQRSAPQRRGQRAKCPASSPSPRSVAFLKLLRNPISSSMILKETKAVLAFQNRQLGCQPKDLITPTLRR